MKKVKSIFLIDDDELICYANRVLIEHYQLAERVQVFNDPIIALDYLKLIEDEASYYDLFAPQIILLDKYMPGMNGFEFLKEFDKLEIFKQKRTDVIMLSTCMEVLEIRRLKTFPFCKGYLIKPMDPMKFRQLLDQPDEQGVGESG